MEYISKPPLPNTKMFPLSVKNTLPNDMHGVHNATLKRETICKTNQYVGDNKILD